MLFKIRYKCLRIKTIKRISVVKKQRQGFALIIALALMGYILALVMSLGLFVRVEVARAGNALEQELARQNALLAMSIALGHLQQEAGMDRVVTARADINDLSSLNPFWTGVWRSNPPASWTQVSPVPPLGAGNIGPGDNYLQTSTGNFSRWLVGMPDGQSLDPLTYDSVADRGQSIATPAVYIVAQGTSGDDSDKWVRVPKIALDSANNRSGHFAWWVGDEGVKARIRGPVAQATLRRASAGGDPRADWWRMSPGSSLPDVFSGVDTAMPFFADRARWNTVSLLEDSPSDPIIRDYWSDYTLSSIGLLTDTRWGGFRGDLTHAFEGPIFVFNRWFNPSNRTFYFVDIGSEFSDYTARFPNWRILRDYYDLKNAVRPDGSMPFRPPDPFDSDGAVSAQSPNAKPYIHNSPPADPKDAYQWNNPVIASIGRLQVSVGLRFEERMDADETVYYAPVVLVKPLVSLYNPYNVRLDLFRGANVRWSNNALIKLSVGGNDEVTFYLREILSAQGESGGPRRDFSMNLPALVLEPGELRLFSISRDYFRSELAGGRWASFDLEMGDAESVWNEDFGFLQLSLDDAWRATVEGPDDRLGQGYNTFGLTDGEKARLRSDNPDDEVSIQVVNSGGGSIWNTYDSPSLTSTSSRVKQYFTSYTSSAVTQSEERSFRVIDALASGVTDNGNLPILLTWGIWQRTAEEPSDNNSRQIRLMVDTNLRAMTGRLDWDGFGANHALASPFSGSLESANLLGFLNEPLPNIIANFDRFSGYTGLGTSGFSLTGQSTDRQVLFDVPRGPLLSLAAFQHAHISRYINDPTYAFGNSFAPLRISDPRRFYTSDYTGSTHAHWDLNWLLNQQIWDSYYFSTIPQNLTTAELDRLISGEEKLLNHRLRVMADVEEQGVAALISTLAANPTFYNAASYLMIDGGFNINSTSERAWEALLSSGKNLQIPVLPLRGTTAGSGGNWLMPEGVPYPRLTHPMGLAYQAGSSNQEGLWSGYRVLSADEIRRLARTIVALIRERGEPFYSLSEFVNRALSTGEDGRAGLLQRAIDGAGLNDDLPGLGINPTQLFSPQMNADALTGATQITGAPGYLTQADILQKLGPVLSARSDTFVIRTYGDVVNPSSTNTLSRVWCEAVVQRLPRELVEGSDPLDRDAVRRFIIVDFRWLDADEI